MPTALLSASLCKRSNRVALPQLDSSRRTGSVKDKHAITALLALLGYPLIVSPCPCDRLSLIIVSSGLSHDTVGHTALHASAGLPHPWITA